MIEIIIMGEPLDISSDLSLRLNTVLFSPEKVISDEEKWSFSFEVPCTPKNNRLLGYGNAIPSVNKFFRLISCSILAGGEEVFSGRLAIDSCDGNVYSCNAVVMGDNSIEGIFSSMTLAQLDWSVPFNGVESINDCNSGDTEVMYPFVSYGVFIKRPIYSDDVANDYSDRLIIDGTDKFYYSTFYPSVSAFSLMRRLFESKGYTVDGPDDPLLEKVYLSCHLQDGQIPTYNLAEPSLGTVDMDITWTSEGQEPLEQTLSYPYFKVYQRESTNHSGGRRPVGIGSNEEFFNWDMINRYNMLGSVSLRSKSYLYDEEDSVLVIPADGAYKVELEYELKTSGTSMTVTEKTYSGNTTDPENIVESAHTVPILINETAPVEIQLVRNCWNNKNNIELIKGRHNKAYNGGLYGTTFREWETCYPHENLLGALNPTVALSTSVATASLGADVQYGTNVQAVQGRRPNSSGSGTGSGTVSGHRRPSSYNDTGYIYKDGQIMAYDTNVSPYFICGASSLFEGVNSVIRNGKSWYAGQSSRSSSMYQGEGYNYVKGSSSGSSVISTNYSENQYIGAPQSWISVQGDTMKGKLVCAVWLNKDDILSLEAITRYYDDVKYTISGNCHLKIEAFTPNTRKKAEYDGIGYNSESQFDKDLQLGHFLDSGTTAASYITNLLNAFNLKCMIDGNRAVITSRKTCNGAIGADIDDRVNWKEAESLRVNYPRSMSVRYTVNTDEYGYWETVPQDHVNDTDWAEYGDKGYDIVPLDNVFSTDENSVQLIFSPCWYVPFMKNNQVLNLPCISKYEYMAEGADYDEAMKADGYGLNYRMFFRTPVSNNTVTITNGEVVRLLIPAGTMDGLELSYHDREGTILRKYFSMPSDASDSIVQVETYLTMQEYRRLSDGASCVFDRSRWKVQKITGYDPENKSKAELSLMKE